MATYCVSDLHGCKEEFDALLKQIDFNSFDDLYIIGDVCDRGKDPIGLYKQIMYTKNMHLIMGNHDRWFLKFIPRLIDEIRTPGNLQFDDEMFTWAHFNGGFHTLDCFLDTDLPTCYDIQNYLDKCPYYKELEIMGKKYLLVHAGVEGNYDQKGIKVSQVPQEVLVWAHPGIDTNPFVDTTLVVGHIPTGIYGKQYEGKIINHSQSKTIHIDCGCVLGHTLGCIRLEDQKEFYVPSTYPYLSLGSSN